MSKPELYCHSTIKELDDLMLMKPTNMLIQGCICCKLIVNETPASLNFIRQLQEIKLMKYNANPFD